MRAEVADCASLPMEDASVDLVLGSPPYEDVLDYGIGFKLKGDDWVDWCLPRFMECLRVSRGLVAWVAGYGRTEGYRWSAAPALLIARLHAEGVCLRSCPVYKRFGRPGSGGPDWLRADTELVICATPERGRLPWSDNIAMGHPPKCQPGGRPVSRRRDGTKVRGKSYRPPKLSNPGNVVDCGAVGGGNIGSKLAHETDAPYPEKLAEFFVRSFCPPGGLVLDPFSGSGTTAAVAVRAGRDAAAFDIRQSQIELTRRRVDEVLEGGES